MSSIYFRLFSLFKSILIKSVLLPPLHSHVLFIISTHRCFDLLLPSESYFSRCCVPVSYTSGRRNKLCLFPVPLLSLLFLVLCFPMRFQLPARYVRSADILVFWFCCVLLFFVRAYEGLNYGDGKTNALIRKDRHLF